MMFIANMKENELFQFDVHLQDHKNQANFTLFVKLENPVNLRIYSSNLQISASSTTKKSRLTLKGGRN